MRSNGNHPIGVLVTGNDCVNNLGVVRGLGSHGIPVTLLSFNHLDMVRYSRYVSRKLAYPDPEKSELQFIDFLLNQGRQMGEKYVLIPTSDAEVLAFSRYKKELERYYLLPVPDLKVVQQLVNKRRFYQLCKQLSIPYPKTYFPADISQLKTIGREIGYPYIIKPSYMHLFTAEFKSKCFVINSSQDLDQAVRRLENKDLDVLIQEIIPGKELYSLSTYFNKESEPLAICGYDKLRQYPPDFGIGTLWKSSWREGPINSAMQLLWTIRYHGIAEPEFKKDPRDGKYKFLEINARSIFLNSLPAKCGVDIVYIAYLDTLGQYQKSPVTPQNGILWIYELYDVITCLKQIREGTLGIKEVVASLKGKKVYAIAAWEDPVPFIIALLNLAVAGLKRLLAVKNQTGRHQ